MDKYKAIHTFTLVAEHGSFTKAADILGKTKALLSTQISQLESNMGTKLFNRSTRAISLTQSGELLYQRAKQWLDSWDDIEQIINLSQQQLNGRIRISAPVTFAEQKLMPFIASFHNMHPDIEVHLDLTDRYVDIIHEGYDLAIRVGEQQDSSLITKTIAYAKMGIFISPTFLKKLGGAQHINLDKMTELPFIIDSNQHQHTWSFKKDNHVKTLAFNNKYHQPLKINSAYASAKLSTMTDHLVRIPFFSAEPFLQDKTLVEIFKQWEQPNLPIQIIYSRNKRQPLRIRAFINELSNYFKRAT